MTLEAEVAYLHLLDGVRQNEVPAGFSVHSAPRKAARGRDRDVLMVGLYLTPHKNEAASPSHSEELQAVPPPKDQLDLLVNTYFGTPGSVTAAARATFATVNAKLFDYNRYPPATGSLSGGLCCAILRGSDLYIALAGRGQALVIHPNAVEHFVYPTSEPLPTVGSNPTIEVQYFHTVVAAADYLLLTASMPSGWDMNPLTHLPSAGLESAVARLTRLSGSQASALIVRFAAEEVAPAKSRSSITAARLPTAASATQADPTPQINLEPEGGSLPVMPLAPRASTPEPVKEPDPQPSGITASLAGIIARVRASPAMGEADDIETVPPRPTTAPEPASTPVARSLPSDEKDVVQIGEHVYEFEEAEIQEEPDAPDAEARPLGDRILQPLRNWLAGLPLNRASESMKKGSETLGASLSGSSNNMLRRLLPEGVLRPDSQVRISDRALIAVTILLPIAIALAMGVVYIQRGRNELFVKYLDEARLESGLARTAADPLAAKPHWQTALNYLAQAERVFPGQPSAAVLQREAQGAVDAVDNVQRLTFEPLAPGGFAPNAQLTEIIVNGSEVYVLDATRQAVYRAVLTESNKYVIDRNFACQLGVVGSVVIKRIVDIAWLNTPNIVGQPALMALDEDGDLMYCKTDGTQPEASSLIAPDAGWKTPRAIEIYADRLYVFDPGTNEIWLYDRTGGVFSERPKGYFTGQVLDLSSAINFTITQGEVFILRGDGRLIYCVRDLSTLQANCVENALFSDSRPGHINGDRLDDVVGPRALFYDPPPEPSLYLLDTASSGVYQLSLKLVLQKIYRSTTALPDPVAAIAIGPNKEVFMAAGNNVYWAHR